MTETISSKQDTYLVHIYFDASLSYRNHITNEINHLKHTCKMSTIYTIRATTTYCQACNSMQNCLAIFYITILIEIFIYFLSFRPCRSFKPCRPFKLCLTCRLFKLCRLGLLGFLGWAFYKKKCLLSFRP